MSDWDFLFGIISFICPSFGTDTLVSAQRLFSSFAEFPLFGSDGIEGNVILLVSSLRIWVVSVGNVSIWISNLFPYYGRVKTMGK